MTDNPQELMVEATLAARETFPMTDDLDTTSRTVRLIMQEAYVAGYMRARRG